MAEIESGLNPSAYHPKSGASGLFQFLPSTARQYELNAVFDARANAHAAAALWRDNAKELRRSLGRSPTAGELYLAHQQGAAGAASLLANPGEPATEIVGYKAVTMNGGGGEMTAGAFAAMWIDRFERD
jgi:SLT domain-containing protein